MRAMLRRSRHGVGSRRARSVVRWCTMHLFIGAVATLAVAWGSAYCTSFERANASATDINILEHHPGWIGTRLRTATGTRCIFSIERFPRFVSKVVAAPDGTEPWLTAWRRQPGEQGTLGLIEDARGWPMRCMAASCESTSELLPLSWTAMVGPPSVGTARYRVRDGVELKRGSAGGLFMLDLRMFPYRPLWPGLVVNTLFYAVLSVASFVACRNVVRRGRLEKGRCPKCAYDLQAAFDDGCPECGWKRTADDEDVGPAGPEAASV